MNFPWISQTPSMNFPWNLAHFKKSTMKLCIFSRELGWSLMVILVMLHPQSTIHREPVQLLSVRRSSICVRLLWCLQQYWSWQSRSPGLIIKGTECFTTDEEMVILVILHPQSTIHREPVQLLIVRCSSICITICRACLYWDACSSIDLDKVVHVLCATGITTCVAVVFSVCRTSSDISNCFYIIY